MSLGRKQVHIVMATCCIWCVYQRKASLSLYHLWPALGSLRAIAEVGVLFLCSLNPFFKTIFYWECEYCELYALFNYSLHKKYILYHAFTQVKLEIKYYLLFMSCVAQ